MWRGERGCGGGGGCGVCCGWVVGGVWGRVGNVASASGLDPLLSFSLSLSVPLSLSRPLSLSPSSLSLALSLPLVERRRRDKINNGIVQLSKTIPDCTLDPTKNGQVNVTRSPAFI